VLTELRRIGPGRVERWEHLDGAWVCSYRGPPPPSNPFLKFLDTDGS
jgi:hypothetical protein